ncbi:MAG: HAD family hydrolase [Candidatus Odinarchaeota archaeon]
MRQINIPNYGLITIKNILFDINGTIQFQGELSPVIIDKFKKLKEIYNIYLISADTRGNLKDIAEILDVDYIKIQQQGTSESEAKENELKQLGKENTIAIGNGNNDALMLKNALLGIVIIGNEGASIKSIMNSDVAFPDPLSVLNFLLDEKIMIATLRS